MGGEFDLDARGRISGGRVDLGAYEDPRRSSLLLMR
jgi:hypothetical protein